MIKKIAWYASYFLWVFCIGFTAGQAWPTVAAKIGPVNITAHDALGATHSATGTLNSLSQSNVAPYALNIEYTSPQILCSGFENK